MKQKIDFHWSEKKGLRCEAPFKELAETIVKETISRCPGHHITEITVESIENDAHEIGIFYMSVKDDRLLRKRYSGKVVHWRLYSRTEKNKLWCQYATAGDINNYIDDIQFDKAFKSKNPEDILFKVLKKKGLVINSVYTERTYAIPVDTYAKLDVPMLLEITEIPFDDNPVINSSFLKWEKRFERLLPSRTSRQLNERLRKKMDSIYQEVLNYLKTYPDRNCAKDFGLACWSRKICPENAAAYLVARNSH